MKPQWGNRVRSSTKSQPSAEAHNVSPEFTSTKQLELDASAVPASVPPLPPEPFATLPPTTPGPLQGGLVHVSLANGGCALSLPHPATA